MGSRDWGYAFWLFYFRSCNDSSVHYWTTIKKLEFLTLSVCSCKNSILLDSRITGKFRLTGRSLGEVCSLRASSATGSDQVAQGFAQSGCWTTLCQRQPALLGLCSMDRLLLYGKDFSLSPSWISLCSPPVWRIQLACSMPKKPTSAKDAVWSLKRLLPWLSQPQPHSYTLLSRASRPTISVPSAQQLYLWSFFLHWRPETGSLWFVQMELNVVRNVNDNNKGLHKYVDDKKKIRENELLLMNKVRT